jgi:hypothetical protein
MEDYKMTNRNSYLTNTLLALVCTVFLASNLIAQTSGKVRGIVTDASTGEALIGTNVLIDGTGLGAATDENGEYFILNVSPGAYTMRAEIIGYQTAVELDVRVFIDLTTTVNFVTSVEAVTGEAVEVLAERPLVQPDVAGTVINVSGGDIENIPVRSVGDFISQQAGVEPGMVIRGSGINETAFVVDGISTRGGRDGTPQTAIALTSVDELQIQTGGLGSGVANARGGAINIVTKDPRDRMILDVLINQSPASSMSFGKSVKDINAYWWKPYKDSAVKTNGTDGGGWDQYYQAQYPTFTGWQATIDGATGNAATLDESQWLEVFDWHHRKDTEVKDAFQSIDATFGMPLGSTGLRFLVSYLSNQEPYFYPQARSSFKENNVHAKVMYDLNSSMKLMAFYKTSHQEGAAHEAWDMLHVPYPQRGGTPLYPWGAGSANSTLVFNSNQGISPSETLINQNGDHVGKSVIFAWDRYAVTDYDTDIMGATFTNTVNAKTYYNVGFSMNSETFKTGPNSRRLGSNAPPGETSSDVPDVIKLLYGTGGTGADSLVYTPWGWTSDGMSNPGSGSRLGGHWARGRDDSKVSSTNINFDYTSQLNSTNQLNAGAWMSLYDYDMDYGSSDSVIVHVERGSQRWKKTPTQAGLYAEDKLEFKGMIATLGLSVDYYNPNTKWWDYDDYARELTAKEKGDVGDERFSDITSSDAETQITLNPKIRIAFPITVNSKLYFNYGSYRQQLTAQESFMIWQAWRGEVHQIGDPNNPMPQTVSYEVGYEQALQDAYLLRVGGYYKDSSLQPKTVWYQSIDSEVSYNRSVPYNYSDTRGLEFSLSKNMGSVTGYFNYTYSVRSQGNFGWGSQYENDVTQTEYERTATDHYQIKPVAEPFASANLEYVAPKSMGPLADFRVTLNGGWRAGRHFTWVGPGGATIPGVNNNVQMKDFLFMNARLSKNFNVGGSRVMVFADVQNLLGLKYMYFSPYNPHGGPFEGQTGGDDWDNYMTSLHMPSDFWDEVADTEMTYNNIVGDDRPGTFRERDVAFVPIEVVATAANLPATEELPALIQTGDVLYYVHDTGDWYHWNGTDWGTASSSFVSKVKSDKAYIDMPNEWHRTFLNPRTISVGVRVSF